MTATLRVHGNGKDDEMRTLHRLCITLLLAGFAFACDAESPETRGAPETSGVPKVKATLPARTADASGFSIYLLQDGELALPDVQDLPLAELKLAAEPWIASSDIARYDVSTHCLHLKRPIRKLERRIALIR